MSDLNKCPSCGGPANNGCDREYPPNPYFCIKCSKKDLEKYSTNQMYYIRDTRTIVGNCVMWWALGGHGYTCELDSAQLYEKEEAQRICNNKNYEAYKAEDVEDSIVRHVRMEMLRICGPVTFLREAENIND